MITLAPGGKWESGRGRKKLSYGPRRLRARDYVARTVGPGNPGLYFPLSLSFVLFLLLISFGDSGGKEIGMPY